MDFVHLHVHTQYSLLNGTCQIKDLIKKAKELNQKSIAITDSGAMYGVIEFYNQAYKNNIKPIIGCEVYICDNINIKTCETNNLILLCKNNIGYKNLINLVSNSFLYGYYNKPRIDINMLKQYSNGLICLKTCCLYDEISFLVSEQKHIEIKNKIISYKNIFNENDFYLEIQNHGFKEELQINNYFYNISKELYIPIVATNNVQYINKKDKEIQDILLCIKNNINLNKIKQTIKYYSNEYYLKNNNEIYNLFKKYDFEVLNNSNVIANACNIENLNINHKNIFPVVNIDLPFQYLKKLCFNNIIKNDKINRNNNKSIYIKRLNYELNIINKMNLIDYFLVIYDIILFAKKNNIMFGPGRGSVAGSLVAYLLGITNIDPIEFSLYFERFLNVKRKNMPDIDIDFCYEKRKQIIQYIKKKYGENCVAHIITFGKFTNKSSMKDIARIMNYSSIDINNLMKLFTEIENINLKKIDKNLFKKNEYFQNNKFNILIDSINKIKGNIRNISTHAAGIIITKDSIEKYIPIIKTEQNIITQFTTENIEQLGILKIDFLGLKTITLIDNIIKLINLKNKDFNINDMNLQDKNIFNMLTSGDTAGVFQLESNGITQLIKQIKPQNFEDLISVISLYRPGTIQYINKFIQHRNNPSMITYKHQILKSILDITYGCIIYQEQVMEIFQKIAGYSLEQADLIRYAISKKENHIITNEYQNFLYGNIEKKIIGAIKIIKNELISKEIFNEIINFSKYAFNKSHATSYAMITYQTAYFKFYYKNEFMASLLTSVIDNTNKFISYIKICKRQQIKIFSPDINKSYDFFSIENEGIRFAISAIKNIGKKFAYNLCFERNKNGNFLSITNFCERMIKYDLNKIILEKLIKTGVFNSMNYNKEKLLKIYPRILEHVIFSQHKIIRGQIDILSYQK